MKLNSKCIICGKLFYRRPAYKMIGGGKFCSIKCKGIWQSQNCRGEDSPSWKGKIKIKCLYCGKEFKVYQYRKNTAQFCSIKCHNLFRQKRIKKECLTCGKIFITKRSEVARNHGQFCSKKCYGLANKGEKNNRWRGGASFEPYGKEFNKALKENIRKRDNYSCQECGYIQKQLGYKLSIHHIDYNKQNNNPNNLISLCKNCHMQTIFNRKDWIKYYQDKVESVITISQG